MQIRGQRSVYTEGGHNDPLIVLDGMIFYGELSEINPEGIQVSLEDFYAGLEVELEHGIRYKDANVTNNHPILTGLIVVAHLKESLDYYKLLEVAELEGDLLKAVTKGDAPKIKSYYRRLAKARIALRQAELDRLG